MDTPLSREEIKARVKDAADIVQVIGENVQLKKTGANYSGLCPFHADKDPSFSVNPQRQFFHCFGCGESGDVFSFLMKYHQMSFPEALEELARRHQIELPTREVSPEARRRSRQREKIFEINELATSIYHDYLLRSPGARKAREYLQHRDIPDEIVKKFRLGYCPPPETRGWSFLFSLLRGKGHGAADIEKAGLAVPRERGGYYDRFRDRVMFPIVDMSGRVVAFGGRILGDGMPKYMNSPETPVFDKSRVLFGLHPNREAIRMGGQALVVEGNFDLLALVAHGIANVVAPLGTALTRRHIRLLKGYSDEVVLIFDGDAAGLKAAMRAVPLFLAEHVVARVVVLPREHDPDTFVREKGAEGLQELITAAAELPEFILGSLTNRYGSGLSGKNRIVAELIPLIEAAGDSVQRELMIGYFSQKLGVAPRHLISPAQPRPRGRTPEREPAGFDGLSRTQRQLLDFLILYPEFTHELVDAGAGEVLRGSAAEKIVETLLAVSAGDEPVTVDRLLDLFAAGEEREYIARLVIAAPLNDSDGETPAEQLRDTYLSWLQTVRHRRKAEEIRREIEAAQLAGDHERVMALLESKQQVAKKLADFSCHLVKEI